VTVAVWTGGWEGAVSNPADVGGNWDVFLNIGAVAGNWQVAVVRAETCQPKSGGGGYSAVGCERLSNVVNVQTVASPCAPGSGGVQWPEVTFLEN
jgi:hypothetical protein